MVRELELICKAGRESSSRGRPLKRHETTAEGGLTKQRRRATEPRLWTREAGSERKEGY